ncbi:nuclear transport factor 2 family protein [Agrococcus sp. ARC_14]|uniref:nuclear transport factor 2 family protein n=1 Tax=Agrococcus sp. ARC_14 TaxID=2919927 RepID=UPI001F064B0C|nr:nuclear transport factor 2 family protein [Agrococcus sp. ARC_14]MCH1883537.1 nuclear transport factor 2 family protein [Agrococcus sp. ARC_14]
MTEPTIPEPVASLIDAINRSDEGAFLDALGEQGVVDDWGREFVGRDAIKTWSDKELIGAAGTLTPLEVTEAGDEVTVIGDWRSSWANGRSSFAFRVVDGQIVRMTIREG